MKQRDPYAEVKAQPYHRRAAIAITLSTIVCALWWPFFLVYPASVVASLIAPVWTLQKLEALARRVGDTSALNPPHGDTREYTQRIKK